MDSIKFTFEIRENGELYELKDVTAIRLAVAKPNGVIFYQDCEIIENLCEVVLNSTAYDALGTYLGELYLTTEATQVVTRQFEYQALNSILAVETTAPTGVIYWRDILNKPETFIPSVHSHLWADISDKPLTFAPEAHTHVWGEINEKPPTMPPSPHTHAMADVTGLGEALSGKSSVGHTHIWTDITDKPTAFNPTAHTHAIADVNGLANELSNKSNVGHTHAEYLTEAKGDVRYELKGTSGAPTAHTHAMTDITGLESALSGKSNIGHSHGWGEIANKPNSFPPTAHGHAWAEISDKPTSFAPSAHTHTYGDITGPLSVDAVNNVVAGRFVNVNGQIVMLVHSAVNAFQSWGANNAPKAFAIEGYAGDVLPLINLRAEVVNTEGPIQEQGVNLSEKYASAGALGGHTLWSGTQAEYDAIATKNPTTLYFVTG